MHRNAEGAVCGTPAGLAALPLGLRPLDSLPCVLPTKTPLRRSCRLHPLCEVDSGTRLRVEFSQAVFRPELSDFALSNYLPVIIHETGFVPASSY